MNLSPENVVRIVLTLMLPTLLWSSALSCGADQPADRLPTGQVLEVTVSQLCAFVELRQV